MPDHVAPELKSSEICVKSLLEWFFSAVFYCVLLKKLFIRSITESENLLFLFIPASGERKGPHITVCERQSALQQVQEPSGEHHALRDHTCVSAADQRSGGIRLYQRQLH